MEGAAIWYYYHNVSDEGVGPGSYGAEERDALRHENLCSNNKKGLLFNSKNHSRMIRLEPSSKLYIRSIRGLRSSVIRISGTIYKFKLRNWLVNY